MENTVKEKWYTAKEAGEVAGVQASTLTTAIRHGKLVAKQISDSSRYGFHYMISESALIDWVEDRKSRKADALPKSLEEYSVEDIAQEILRRIHQSYNKGVKDGRKSMKAELIGKFREAK